MAAWTQEDVDRHNAKLGAKMPAHVPAPQKSKYKNIKTIIGGERFDSKREADHWLLLRARVELGEITDLRRQVSFELSCPGLDYDEHVVAHYVADYTFFDDRQKFHALDAKGARTRMYLLKKKWMELQHGIIVEEV